MRPKILCVEDNPQNMRLVRKILTAAGYDVVEAANGVACLTAVEKERFDLILMDMNLPDIDGVEVTKRLKADPEIGLTPIVAVTANAMYGDRDRYLEAGCAQYVAKPIMRQELLNTIARLLA